MHRLCLPALTLALGMPLLASAAEPTPVSAPAGASVTAKVTVSDQDALNDDILAVIDLPLAAAEAREAGVDEAELKEALDTSREAGLPASEATEVVATEAELTRTRGVKKGFGRWVRVQVASGLRGKKLADKVKARKEDTKELDAKQQDELKTKLAAQAETNRAYRQRLLEKRRELVAAGKKPVIGHKERHDKLVAKIATRIDGQETKIDAKQDAALARLRELEVKLSTAAEVDKAPLEAEKARLEQQIGRLDKREDRLDKIEDRLTAPDKKGGAVPRPGYPEAKEPSKHPPGHTPGKAAPIKAADKKAADPKPTGSSAQ